MDATFITSEGKKYLMVSLSAVIWKEDGVFIAKCSEVGTISQGKTMDEALKNLREATELYLEECPMKEHSRPILTTFEVSEYASPA